MQDRNPRPKQLTTQLLCAWYRELYDRIFRAAQIRMRDIDKAEDAASETLLRANKNRDSYFYQLGTVEQWLMGISRNVCREMKRKESRTSTISIHSLEAISESKKGEKNNGV